ncbi:hypothetical protein LXL04_030427 [Taraxacum kok-saghyz]
MDLLLSFVTLAASIICFLLFCHTWLKSGVHRSKNPPVPEASGSLPIIGHLHLLASSDQAPHKLFGSMADKFGPIFTIKLGVYRALVVNNADMAKECLTTNDRVFAGRPKIMASELMAYNYASLALAPYGPYWREMRKIVVLELASQHRVQVLEHIRVSEVKSFVANMYENWVKNRGSSETIKVDMTQLFANLNLNMTLRMAFGDGFSRGDKQKEDEVKNTIKRIVELFGAFVPSDAIPALRWLDIGGYEKEMKKLAKVLDDIIEGWLQDHKKKMSSTTQHIDEGENQVFMAALLSRVQEAFKENIHGFSIDAMVKATCVAVVVAAMDTTTATLIWTLALLVNNPNVLKKAQEELENHVGKDRMVEESDLNNLVYLQAIIKESMRLYPALPLSVPHESTEDCIIGGYTVPKGTRLFVNFWKIQHDPEIWEDPFEFKPERFLTGEKEIDVKGHNFELIPFGSGRRICLGLSVAMKAMQLILASLIHAYDFQNPSSEKIDMTGSFGATNHKANPLELLVAPRLSPDCMPLVCKV